MTTPYPTTQHLARAATHAVSVALALDSVNADALAHQLRVDPATCAIDATHIEPLARSLLEQSVRSKIAADALYEAAVACYDWLAAEATDARTAEVQTPAQPDGRPDTGRVVQWLVEKSKAPPSDPQWN